MILSTGVEVWWLTLSGIALFNIGLWFWSGRKAEDSYQRWQRVLSAGFVFGCAFRSFIPRADVQRICLIDSFWASVFVGRSVATVAELCFVAQWALLLRATARGFGVRPIVALSYLVVPMIAVAEAFSWYAVLTTNYIGNTVEESTWTLTATMVTLCNLVLWRRATGRWRTGLFAASVLGVGYVLFMCNVDVPMYATRWLADTASHREYFSIAAGLHDVTSRWVVTGAWQDWHEEMPWMSLYFSVAVWASIVVARLRPNAATA
jgi:hypothetical protein